MATRIIHKHETSPSRRYRIAFAARSIAMSAVVALSLLGISGCVAEFGGDTDDGAYFNEDEVDSSEHMVVNGQRVQIRAAHSLKCADSSPSTSNGVPLVQWDCWGGTNQRFYTYLQPDGFWKIVSAYSGKCLEVANPWYDGEVVRQNGCHDGDTQDFTIEYSAGSHFIRTRVTGKCLDVSGYGLGNGAYIVQWGCNWMLNQRFYIDPA